MYCSVQISACSNNLEDFCDLCQMVEVSQPARRILAVDMYGNSMPSLMCYSRNQSTLQPGINPETSFSKTTNICENTEKHEGHQSVAHSTCCHLVSNSVSFADRLVCTPGASHADLPSESCCAKQGRRLEPEAFNLNCQGMRRPGLPLRRRPEASAAAAGGLGRVERRLRRRV